MNHYGLSEMMGPGVASEYADTRDGLTLWEDHFYPEIIDPETGAVLPDGEAGELVLTPLTREAMPLIRYRTRDLTRLLPGTGRAMRRIERVKGRSDDMLIIRGVNVFPSQIEAVLAAEPRLAPYYVLEVTRPHRLDELAVMVETRPERYAGERGGAGRARSGGRASHQGAYRCNLCGAGRAAGDDRALGGQGEAGHRPPAEGMRGDPGWTLPLAAPVPGPDDPSAILRPPPGSPPMRPSEWLASEQTRTADLATDRNRYAAFWLRSRRWSRRLPAKPRRNAAEAAAAALILGRARDARERFLAVHAEAVYDEVTAREMLRHRGSGLCRGRRGSRS